MKFAIYIAKKIPGEIYPYFLYSNRDDFKFFNKGIKGFYDTPEEAYNDVKKVQNLYLDYDFFIMSTAIE